MNPVVIVGGGMAGLATAFELTLKSVPFVLLEAGPRPGGVVLSEEIDGYTIDAGPDALLAQKPAGIALCEDVGLRDRLISTRPPRLAFIQRGGKLHPLPASSVLGVPTEFGPFIRTRLFTWPGKLRMGAEIFVPAKRDDADESIGAFMRRRFGAEATDYLAEPLLAGIHAGDVDRLSVRALFPRFVEAERASGSLLRSFRKQPRRAASSDGAFRSLPGGLGELVRAVVNRLPETSVRLNTAVVRVNADAEAFVVETSRGEPIAARAVVLATPAFATSRIIATVDAELSRLCSDIPYASTATVALGFPGASVHHPLQGSGFVVPRVEANGILAATWLSSKWDHRAPKGRVLMRAFIGGGRDPRAFELSDREMIVRALAALTPLVGITSEPELARVYRWERASVQHEVGHLARVDAIERALSRRPGLFVTGSGFRGVGIPDCVADGRATAGHVIEWLSRLPAPSAAR
ncbi:MAG TPA: protoporphyrinogen oxidase [Vicinamibacterales bacterium]|jgi:oxygen-dependent protoporphyrinogen oxidase|nr:protoporphyrinogen oxidase [Vicinamibacterales bacterium]